MVSYRKIEKEKNDMYFEDVDIGTFFIYLNHCDEECLGFKMSNNTYFDFDDDEIYHNVSPRQSVYEVNAEILWSYK